MRMRYKTMSQYGIDADTERAIKDRCKRLSADDRKILFNCALSAAPGLEVEVYYSITHMAEREGYYNMARKGWNIPAKPDDFYAYRRKTLAEFYNVLRLCGLWDKETQKK